MKNSILIILFLIFIFILNIIFYYSFDSYSNFIKWLKDSDYKLENQLKKEKAENKDILTELEEIKKDIKNTEIKNKILSEQMTAEKQKEIRKKIAEYKEKEENKSETKSKSKTDTEKEENKSEIILWKNYTDIIKKFSSYDLKLLDINTNLFDLTNEYPDEYFEYYSRDLTLYFFTTKKYNDVLDIFEILEWELPFTINKANNIWEKSFYINLNEDLDDWIVRTVISYNWIVFGLKLKKSEYNKIKEILKKFKN